MFFGQKYKPDFNVMKTCHSQIYLGFTISSNREGIVSQSFFVSNAPTDSELQPG